MKTRLAIAALAVVAITAGGADAVSLITSAQIADHTIQPRDLSPATVKFLRGQRGPAGPAGNTGLPGPAGGFDPAKVTYVEGTHTFVPGGGNLVLVATCPAGSKMIAGGFFGYVTVASAPQPSTNSWAAGIINTTSTALEAWAYVVCVRS